MWNLDLGGAEPLIRKKLEEIMANKFVAMCYIVAKKAGVDTSKMDPDEVVEWYKEHNKQGGGKQGGGDKKQELKQAIEKAMHYKDNKNSTQETNLKGSLTNNEEHGKIIAEKRALKDFESLKQVLSNPNLDELIQKSQFAFFSKGREDLIVKPMIEEMGFNKLPQFVDDNEFEKLKKTNIYLCRGLTNLEHIDSFEKGDMFVGLGINGSGVYTTVYKEKAQSYAGESGGVVEMLLDSSAKVGEGVEIAKKAKELLFSLKNGSNNSGEPIDLGLDVEKLIKISEGNNKRLVTLLALAEGYDAINVGNGDYIILNRSAVIMRRKDEEQ